ncbi:MAG: EamA family transporter RarD [Clostridia bacterium]|nr:EamA family transporter RarD [Clostridia bacterium]
MEYNLKNDRKNYRFGMTAAIGCSCLWGVLPIYWKSLIPIDSFVIIFYRIFLVGVVSFLGAWKLYGLKAIMAPLRVKGNKLKFFVAGVLVTMNWSMYIWAVNAGYVIQTCIGYYIEPLMVCIFGVVFFKEKLTKYKLGALLLACVGIVVILVHFGELPFIALWLALTFALYAAAKKSFRLPALMTLFYETMFLMIPALAVVIYMEITGRGALDVAQPYQYGLLLLCGLLTAIPLGLFAEAANRISLVSLGITEYLSPSIALVLGIFLFKEGFDLVQFVSFVIIWVGLVIFTIGEFREEKNFESENAPQTEPEMK